MNTLAQPKWVFRFPYLWSGGVTRDIGALSNHSRIQPWY